MTLQSELKRVPFVFLRLCAVTFLLQAAAVDANERPNVVVVMVDDMGYSDLGCYGSEIETPRIDALAKGGLRFSQFYNTSKMPFVSRVPADRSVLYCGWRHLDEACGDVRGSGR